MRRKVAVDRAGAVVENVIFTVLALDVKALVVSGKWGAVSCFKRCIALFGNNACMTRHASMKMPGCCCVRQEHVPL